MVDTLEKQVCEILIATGLKLCLAESCTGGLIAHRITNVAGSSEYFLAGVVAYSYEAKETLLGVRKSTLTSHGAVSQETVLEMARGVRWKLHKRFPMEQTVGVSVSGIAGPGGGLPGKPVGLVWIGLSTPDGDKAIQFLGNGNREENKAFSADKALEFLLEYLRQYAGKQTQKSVDFNR
jgi:PncC family amidohydrolase